MSCIRYLDDEDDDVSGGNGRDLWARFMRNPPALKCYKFHEDAKLPMRTSDGAAGFDIFSVEDAVLAPRERKLISTGLQMIIPSGFHGHIRPRSGLARNYGIHVGAGILDEDFLGEVKCLLFNLGSEEFRVEKGTRVAQLILIPIITPRLMELTEPVKASSSSSRSPLGFGSSGMK